MARPLQMYVYVHEAILREVAEIEERSKELNRDDSDEVAGFAERLAWFHRMLLKHEEAEENILFPAMNERHEFIAETYFFDHDDFEEHLWGGLDAAIAGVRDSTGNGQRKEQGLRLYRETVALHEHMRLHISKENELLIPKLEHEFDIPEQAEIAGAMAGFFDPELMGQTVVWMYQGQSPQDREGMVRFLQMILPEEAFAGMTGMLAGLDADAWADVQKRIPELA